VRIDRRLCGALAAAVVAVVATAGGVRAQEARTVEIGKEAPGFRLNDHTGKAVRLEDFRGKSWVVLAFFPKAMTGG
jgi:peroxiredoxin Q/BCP